MSVERFGQNAFDASGMLSRVGFSINQEGGISGGRPSFGVYRGNNEVQYHTFKRGFTDFDHHIKMVYPEMPALDTLIEGRIDQARKQGRNVVVIDLGGGIGNFTRQPLVEPSVLARSRKRLAGKSVDTQVRFYSVTDAPTEQDHLRVTSFSEANNPGIERITANEVNYSITSSQTLKKLLQGIGEHSADIIVASSFMQYLRPQVFERLLQDIVDTLEPGGRFMAFGYATLAGRFLSVDDGHAEENYPVVFEDPRNPEGQGVSNVALRAWGDELLTNGATSDEQLIEAIERIQEVMFSSDFYSQPQLGDFRGHISNLLNAGMRKGKTPRATFETLLKKILPDAEANIRIQAIKAEKDKIVDDLAERNAAVASIEHRRIPNEDQGLDAIVIKKHIEGKRKQKRDHTD